MCLPDTVSHAHPIHRGVTFIWTHRHQSQIAAPTPWPPQALWTAAATSGVRSPTFSHSSLPHFPLLVSERLAGEASQQARILTSKNQRCFAARTGLSRTRGMGGGSTTRFGPCFVFHTKNFLLSVSPVLPKASGDAKAWRSGLKFALIGHG